MARANSGYVKLHRSLNTSVIGRDGVAMAVFMKLVSWANWKETRIDGEPLKIGELVTGIDELAEHTGFHRATVARKLILMENEHMLRRLKRHKGTKITIVNYEKYQCDDSSHETQVETVLATDLRQACDKPATDLRPYEESKNIKIEELNKGVARTRVDQNPPFDIPPGKKLDLTATLAKTKVVHLLQTVGNDEVAAKASIDPIVWRMLEAKYPKNTWGNIAAEYDMSIRRKRVNFFELDLKTHFEAQILFIGGVA